MMKDLCEFLNNHFKASYFAISSYEHRNYFTVLNPTSFSLEDKTENIVEFVNKHIGQVKNFRNMGDRFDFYCITGSGVIWYSLFDYSQGVIDV